MLRYHSTLQDQGISVMGPQGITKFISDIGMFSGSIFRLNSSHSIQSTEFSKISDAYVDDNIMIKPVVFEAEDVPEGGLERQSVCYICRFDNLPGTFLSVKAIEFGIPRELFDDLICGKTVELPDGQQVR